METGYSENVTFLFEYHCYSYDFIIKTGVLTEQNEETNKITELLSWNYKTS